MLQINMMLLPQYLFLIVIFSIIKEKAQKWWVSKSLENFKSDLKKLNIGLEIIKGDEISFFSKIKSNSKISVYWNKVYEPNELEKDKKIMTDFSKKNKEFKFFKGKCT